MNLPHNPYDHFFKTTLAEYAQELFSYVLGTRVLDVIVETLEEEQAILRATPDMVFFLVLEDERRILGQLEEETGEPDGLCKKLIQHFYLLEEKYGQKPLQFVGFLKDIAHRFRNGLNDGVEGFGTGPGVAFIAFNFSDVPADRVAARRTLPALAVSLFCDRSRLSDEAVASLMDDIKNSANEKDYQILYSGLQLALTKQRISEDLYVTLMGKMIEKEGEDIFWRFATEDRFGTKFLWPKIQEYADKQSRELAENAYKSGRDEGIRENQIRTARAMHNKGADAAFIFEITGLRPEEYLGNER